MIDSSWQWEWYQPDTDCVHPVIVYITTSGDLVYFIFLYCNVPVKQNYISKHCTKQQPKVMLAFLTTARMLPNILHTRYTLCWIFIDRVWEKASYQIRLKFSVYWMMIINWRSWCPSTWKRLLRTCLLHCRSHQKSFSRLSVDTTGNQ